MRLLNSILAKAGTLPVPTTPVGQLDMQDQFNAQEGNLMANFALGPFGYPGSPSDASQTNPNLQTPTKNQVKDLMDKIKQACDCNGDGTQN
jgi:hypothetical protein